jgi:DNA-binding response OmpR family regulator
MTKVLLAEDDPTMLALLKTLLSMEGFQVAALEAEEDILSAMQREQPDVLLLDVHLSKQNGLEVLKKIRQDITLKKAPVVMTSGTDLTDECMNCGANDFLLKPYMPDDLVSMLKRHAAPTAESQ